MLIYINGNFVDIDQPVILANERGLLLGDGMFTTFKVVNTKLLYFDAHYQRLKSNSEIIHLPFKYTKEELLNICLELIKINKLESATLIIRISLTRGKSQRGIDIPNPCIPSIIISASISNTALLKPINLTISKYKRNEYSPIIHVKTLNYLEAILAREEAKQLGYDDAILTNTKGFICETTTANIFFIKQGMIYTPKISDGILPGITRDVIINMASNLGIFVNEVTIKQEEINNFNECFISNSAIGVQEVYKINNHIFTENSKTRDIQNEYIYLLNS